MRPIQTTVGPFAAGSTTLIAAGQAVTIGTALTLSGSKPDLPRRILVSPGNDATTARTLTLVGTNVSGNTISEVLALATGTTAAVSALDYASITAATPTGSGWSANIVGIGTVTSGTNTPVASGAWVALDNYGFPQTALQVVVTGTVNYTVEQTLDDPNDPLQALTPATLTWFSHAVLVSQTASQQDNYAFLPKLCRLTINSATATSGSARLVVTQATAPLRL